MKQSPLRLIKRFAEFLPRDKVEDVRTNRRGLYVLYRESDDGKHMEVVYVGMGRRGMKSRLRSHDKTKTQDTGKDWTHFSAFEVWDNIRDEEIVELEELFRHLYRKDSVASPFNKQRNFKKLAMLKNDKLEEWA